MPSKDSKTNFASLRDKILSQDKKGKEYWRSVEEFVDAPEFEEFVKQEYPQHAEEWDNSLSRRNFIKVMGASLAFAGLSGCVYQPPEKIVARVVPQEDILPGKPLYYATSMTLGARAVGLLAECYEGRPIKIEGNPEHPASLGATDVFAQASLLQLYDPDRSQSINFRGNLGTWEGFSTELRAAIEQNRVDGGAGIRFLTETIVSPTVISQFNQILQEMPNARWYQYQPVNQDNAMAGAIMALGAPVNTVLNLDQADRVLSLGNDLFSTFNVRYIKDYIKKRTHAAESTVINRLYVVEPTITITGAKADHRLAIKPSQMPEVAKVVAAALGVSGVSPTTTLSPEAVQWITVMAKDLAAHRGRSVVTVGDEQPPMVHALAHAINDALGNVGTTVKYTEPLQPNAERLQVEGLRELVNEIRAGQVKMLVILGANPVYYTPSDLKIDAQLLNNVPLRIHLGMYADETAELCQWHIPEKHYLETWSDTRAYDGTVSIVQPVINSLYDAKSIHEVLQLFMRENFDMRDYDIVREFWRRQGRLTGRPNTVFLPSSLGTVPGVKNIPVPPPPAANTTPAATPQATPAASPSPAAAPGATPAATPAAAQTGSAQTGSANQQSPTTAAAPGNFDDDWRKVIHDGFIPNSTIPAKNVSVNPGFLSQTVAPIGSELGELEIHIMADPTVYDGRFNNNAWLQELPKPLTKITWDNVALISPRTAARLGLNIDKDYNDLAGGEIPISFINSKGGNLVSDLVTLSYQGAEILKPVPVWVQPGMPDDVITLTLGYGRFRTGRVGTGLGYNAYDVRRSDAPHFGRGSVVKTGVDTHIASTQIHFNLEGRDLLRVYDVEDLKGKEQITGNVYPPPGQIPPPEVMHQIPGEQHETIPGKDEVYDLSMYPEYEYLGYKWGMTIDLNNCVGCNACVIACQAENNIPVVGKEQVERSREMHWLRIDTYYKGDDINNPEGPYFQPVLCMQCELAPCEVVCPVHATVHSAEGLNDMVYNRCVGTRYCSNNCPYKVRRFNFLLYTDWNTPQYKLMRNPEVTPRSRGVMEKCTYCVQRIVAARIEAEKDARTIRDGEVLTACQSVCPADAIVFGDLNDATTKVVQLKREARNYRMLNKELNTQPRTSYLASLKNFNREMPDYLARQVSREAEPGGESH